MEEIIKWCNENNGFLTGLLSLLTVIVSIIAIVVSIRTSRMPYKKAIVFSRLIHRDEVHQPALALRHGAPGKRQTTNPLSSSVKATR